MRIQKTKKELAREGVVCFNEEYEQGKLKGISSERKRILGIIKRQDIFEDGLVRVNELKSKIGELK
jgi:hypothetical protein